MKYYYFRIKFEKSAEYVIEYMEKLFIIIKNCLIWVKVILLWKFL